MIQDGPPSSEFVTGAKRYLDDLRSAISDVNSSEIASAAHVLIKLAERGGSGYVFGNGGSASTAAHFANDVAKVARFFPSKCPNLFCLNDNAAIVTAIANDDGYEHVFSRQINAFLKPVDLVIAISTRGMSNNILAAVQSAKARGVESLAFVGYDGGKLINMVDHYVLIPSHDMQQVEDLHLALGHMISRILWASASTNAAVGQLSDI